MNGRYNDEVGPEDCGGDVQLAIDTAIANQKHLRLRAGKRYDLADTLVVENVWHGMEIRARDAELRATANLDVLVWVNGAARCRFHNLRLTTAADGRNLFTRGITIVGGDAPIDGLNIHDNNITLLAYRTYAHEAPFDQYGGGIMLKWWAGFGAVVHTDWVIKNNVLERSLGAGLYVDGAIVGLDIVGNRIVDPVLSPLVAGEKYGILIDGAVAGGVVKQNGVYDSQSPTRLTGALSIDAETSGMVIGMNHFEITDTPPDPLYVIAGDNTVEGPLLVGADPAYIVRGHPDWPTLAAQGGGEAFERVVDGEDVYFRRL